MKLFGAPDLKGYFVMKKAICMILALTLALSLAACGEKAPQTVNTTLDGTPEQIIEKIYAAHTEKEMKLPLMTMEVDLQDTDSLSYNMGLDSGDRLSAAAISEPMMGQAYSLVVARVKDAADAEQMAKDLYENVDTNKWICVEADTKTAAYYGDVVMFFMVNSTFAESATTESIGQAFNTVCNGGATFVG